MHAKAWFGVVLSFLPGLLLGAAVFTAVYTVTRASSMTMVRLGLRGMKRQHALRKNEAWAALEPFVRWLGARIDGVLSEQHRAAIDKQLVLAGDVLGLIPEELVALSIFSGAAAATLGYFIGAENALGGPTALLGFTVGAIIPLARIQSMAQQRLLRVSRALPSAIDLLALSMSAGLDFPRAVRQVIEKSSNPSDPLIEEFMLIQQNLGLGKTRKQALLEFSERVPAETVIEFVNAVIQAEERGNPLAEFLTIQASTSRTRRSVRAEKLASKAGAAMLVPLILVFMSVLALLLGPVLLSIGKMGVGQ